MDPTTSAGSLVLPAALVVGGFGAMVGAVTFLFQRLLSSLKEQVTDLKIRVDRGEERYERLAERHITVLEGSLIANTKALLESNDAAEDRFKHLMAHMTSVLDAVRVKQ